MLLGRGRGLKSQKQKWEPKETETEKGAQTREGPCWAGRVCRLWSAQLLAYSLSGAGNKTSASCNSPPRGAAGGRGWGSEGGGQCICRLLYPPTCHCQSFSCSTPQAVTPGPLGRIGEQDLALFEGLLCLWGLLGLRRWWQQQQQPGQFRSMPAFTVLVPARKQDRWPRSRVGGRHGLASP